LTWLQPKKALKLLASDFSAKGKLLSKTGQDSLAMIELKKALELDSTVTDLYSDIAFAYYKSKKYNDALTYYLKKIAAGKPTVNDYVYLGLSYYQTKQFALADSAFKKVISVSPDLILAHKWRAKSNSQLDPDSKLALAKPHFEKVVELILAKPRSIRKKTKKI
jgi:tetratricopeptide (TPR) repeat protein